MANEINRILKQFAELQHDNHWTNNSFKEVLHSVDAEQAKRTDLLRIDHRLPAT